MNASDILTKQEIKTVLSDLDRRARRSVSSRMNLTIFRLACCCGLRRKEICGLTMADFILSGPRPALRIRKENTKGRVGKRKSRRVPLDWDAKTREDLKIWHDYRRAVDFAQPSDPFICGRSPTSKGKHLIESLVAKRWRTAIKVLGAERLRQLSVHKGRHTFISHALHAGHSLTAVRDAAGHSNVQTTNIYLHTLDRPNLPDVFGST